MDVQNDVRVTFRVDKDLKQRAENLFERLGVNMSTALNIFLRKAVDEEAIPFPVSAKSNVFANGYTANGITNAFEIAVRDEIEKNLQKGFPVAKYDTASKRAYLESADGAREYIDG